MTHQFADAIWQAPQDVPECFGCSEIQSGKDHKSEREISSPACANFSLKRLAKPETVRPTRYCLATAAREFPLRSKVGNCGRCFPRATYASDGELLSQANDNVRNSWQNVHVLVSVEMGRQNSVLNTFEICCRSSISTSARLTCAGHNGPQQATRIQMQPPCAIHKTGNAPRG